MYHMVDANSRNFYCYNRGDVYMVRRKLIEIYYYVAILLKYKYLVTFKKNNHTSQNINIDNQKLTLINK